MEEVLIIAPLFIVLMLVGSAIFGLISQRRVTATYTRLYEQADARADKAVKECGEQVERALEAAQAWKTAFDSMENAFNSMKATNEKNVENCEKAQGLANSALDECANYRRMLTGVQ